MEKWIEIARTGTFTDSAGRPQTFTEQDLDAIARTYDPDRRDAPLVFGHPQTDAAPAFGWVEKLKHEGAKLFATFAHVPGEVKKLVAKKHYRHVSMSLMPDRVSLRHVALLGAAQPATFDNRQDTIRNLKPGEELFLERQPNNSFDANAILIKDVKGKDVGFLKADLAKFLAKEIDQDFAEYEIIVTAITGRENQSYGVNVLISKIENNFDKLKKNFLKKKAFTFRHGLSHDCLEK